MNANSLHIIYQPVYFSQKAPKESKDKEEVKEKSPEPKKEKAAKKQQAESPAKQEKVEKKEQKSQNNKATSVFFFDKKNGSKPLLNFQQGQEEESRSCSQVGRGDQEQEKWEQPQTTQPDRRQACRFWWRYVSQYT